MGKLHSEVGLRKLLYLLPGYYSPTAGFEDIGKFSPKWPWLGLSLSLSLVDACRGIAKAKEIGRFLVADFVAMLGCLFAWNSGSERGIQYKISWQLVVLKANAYAVLLS